MAVVVPSEEAFPSESVLQWSPDNLHFYDSYIQVGIVVSYLLLFFFRNIFCFLIILF